MNQHTNILAAALAALAVFAADAGAQSKGGSGTTSTSTGGPVAIDQAKADAGGVSSDDAPGFPITISQPGSYRLMSNLVVTSTATTAIVITSPGVTLDLNGFEIRGPNNCTGGGTMLSCPSLSLPANAIRGHGIDVAVNTEAPASVMVENGAVRGFAGHGLHASGQMYNYSVRRLRVSHSGIYGINAGAKVIDSVIERNAMGGIYAAAGVTANLVMFNKGPGIIASLARSNAQWNNGADNSASYD